MFFPSSVPSPHALDLGMRTSLAESLSHIYDSAAGHVGLADVDVAKGLAEIRAHRVGPGVFGRYYDLVFAVHGERYEDAGALFREIVALSPQQPSFAVLPFTPGALGVETDRYARLLGLESGADAGIAAPDPRAWPGFKDSVAAALELIEATDPALSSELRTLVVEIVGASPAATNGRGFGGASSFMLWGAVLLSVGEHSNRLDAVAGLIHEAAHQLLFGLSVNDPLVENSIDERYGSPLRTDPRPMDGIFHATFVCARMHYGYARLLEEAKKALCQADRDLIEGRLGDYRKKFFDGLETVQRFGRTTANGDRILSAASDYMRSAG